MSVRTRASSLFSVRGCVIGIAAALFLVICVLPGLYMFGLSFVSPNGAFTFSNYTRLVLEPRQRELLLTSSALGFGSAAVATALGMPLGYLLARADLPGRWLLRLGLILPLVIPPYVLALVWIYATGPAGLVSKFAGRDLLSEYTYSLPAAALVLGIAFYPLPMLATEAALRRVSGSLEEAGMLVASARRVARKITLPLIAPSVAAAALIVFALAVSEFGVPGLLRVRVFTTEVFTAFAALYDFGRATALALPLLVITIVAAAFAKWLAGERLLVTHRALRPGLALKLGRAKAATITALVALIGTVAIAPIVVLAVQAKNLVSSAAASSAAIRNSFLISVIATTLIVSLGLILGYGRARSRSGIGALADFVFIAVFAVPSTVVGIGLIGLWNRPEIPSWFFATPAMIVLAYMARFVPVATLILAGSVRQVPLSTEDAAEVAGAGWGRSFLRVTVPQLRGGIAAAWLAVFIFAFGELGATVLVTPPGESTLPVRVYTLIANAPPGQIAALALVQVVSVVVPLFLLALFIRRAEARA